MTQNQAEEVIDIQTMGCITLVHKHLATNRLKIKPTAIGLTPPSFFFKAVKEAPKKIGEIIIIIIIQYYYYYFMQFVSCKKSDKIINTILSSLLNKITHISAFDL